MKRMPTRLDALWLAMLAATALAWWLGESGSTSPNAWPSLVVLALAFAKGWWVAMDFMALRTAPRLWKRLVTGWLVVVIALLGAVLMAS